MATKLKTLTHTARILVQLEQTPETPRKGEYALALGEYRLQWQSLSQDDRDALVSAAAEIHDMTDERLAAAVAALEA